MKKSIRGMNKNKYRTSWKWFLHYKLGQKRLSTRHNLSIRREKGTIYFSDLKNGIILGE